MKEFGYPDTIKSQAAQISSKTRKRAEGKFEAVAAIFFMGKRGLTLYSLAATRQRAVRQAEHALGSQSALKEGLQSGKVSYSPFIL